VPITKYIDHLVHTVRHAHLGVLVWCIQGDHSPDNVKFLDDSLIFPWRFPALLRGTRHLKCYSYHARSSVTVSSGGRNATIHDPKPYLNT